MDIGYVNLHCWQINCGNSIPDGITIVGISRGIDQDAVYPVPTSLNAVHQFPFMVALEEFQLAAQLPA
jgi:hypothetical protein